GEESWPAGDSSRTHNEVDANPDSKDRHPGREWHANSYCWERWADQIAAADQRGRTTNDHAEHRLDDRTTVRQSGRSVGPGTGTQWSEPDLSQHFELNSGAVATFTW